MFSELFPIHAEALVAAQAEIPGQTALLTACYRVYRQTASVGPLLTGRQAAKA